ncbi:hypothetical protein MG296_11135 [Flavobacteriaceae bacterium TK19130]|nr:hypothetical protein [Thermobacterium salinum]
MKKIFILLFTVSLILGTTSCTPEQLYDQGVQPQACCGEDEPIKPPPPPPPPPPPTGG